MIAALMFGCAPAKQFMPARHIRVRETEDPSTIVQVVETDVEARQRSDLNKMLGGWDTAIAKCPGFWRTTF